MNRQLIRVVSILILAAALVTLAACAGSLGGPTPFTPGVSWVLSTETNVPCEACAQATLSVALTQDKSNANVIAVATAERMRADAQATLNAVSAAQGAALTQEKNNANVIAAQVAATADIVRANALATLNAAGATQNAALTLDAIRQTQAQFSLQVAADAAAQNAAATVTQQAKDALAAGTQTAIANLVATQAREAAVAEANQTRRNTDERQASLTFLWMWCLPVFLIGLALLGMFFFWRWTKLQESRPVYDAPSAGELQAPVIVIEPAPPLLESYNADSQDQDRLAMPEGQVRGWMEEVKHELIEDAKDDADDTPDR